MNIISNIVKKYNQLLFKKLMLVLLIIRCDALTHSCEEYYNTRHGYEILLLNMVISMYWDYS